MDTQRVQLLYLELVLDLKAFLDIDFGFDIEALSNTRKVSRISLQQEGGVGRGRT